ncbi:MAG TPA: hypothetical protein VJ970_01205 [Flavobacteriaceae bacterium]|nr:hypothetical protein [Flavobacteriaceae bacterium]
MPKDLRKMLQQTPENNAVLSKNHRSKFESKLHSELHKAPKKRFAFLKIAASIVLIVGLFSTYFYVSNVSEKNQPEIAKIESLGSISPELRKIEDYYLASIHTEIANLPEGEQYAPLLDGYLQKIDELTKEYKTLTIALNTEGLNEKNINALIDNLQLRLKLLYQLKEQLAQLKNSNTTNYESTQI